MLSRLCGWLAVICSLQVQATEVILANLQQQGPQVQLEMLLDQHSPYHIFTLDHPFRVVVDLESVNINATLKALPLQLDSQHPYLSKIRIAPFSANVTRIVFDIKTDVKPQVTDLNADTRQQQRFAISIAPAQPLNGLPELTTPKTNEQASGAVTSKDQTGDKPLINAQEAKNSEGKASDTKSADAKLVDVKAAETKTNDTKANESKPADVAMPAVLPPKQAKPGKKLITIAVDAGHGGEDPGARGAKGSHEKEITLAIAKRLKAQIDEDESLQAILIRDGDYFVPLGDRVKKARAAKADLFISIHADSFINSTARGSSVFALSERGATSVGARYLAKKENEVDLIGGVSLNNRDMDLAKTLLDLSQTATIHDSIRLGKAVLKRIANINTLHSKYVEQAAFAVLKAPDIPSILVETAFISNPDEEARLNDDAYQEKLVNAILGGVKAFVATNPAFAKK